MTTHSLLLTRLFHIEIARCSLKMRSLFFQSKRERVETSTYLIRKRKAAITFAFYWICNEKRAKSGINAFRLANATNIHFANFVLHKTFFIVYLFKRFVHQKYYWPLAFTTV